MARAITPDGRYIVGYGGTPPLGAGKAISLILVQSLVDTVPKPASLLALGAGLTWLLLRRRTR